MRAIIHPDGLVRREVDGGELASGCHIVIGIIRAGGAGDGFHADEMPQAITLLNSAGCVVVITDEQVGEAVVAVPVIHHAGGVGLAHRRCATRLAH